ncbi:repetitive organellar protein-like [Cydia strobilella]|uniref:repetitive organellar protein-like n=1 Tax=Cydia strobilella TaxID=1100964 RepID=UPI003007547A
MDESEENMSTEDINNVDSPVSVKIKPKKRSLVERELETNLTARVTSPVTGEVSSTSRYGRARRLKTASDMDAEKIMKPLKVDVSKQPQAYKMHASNSPIQKESPQRTISVGSSIEHQIENIYNENISLSRFGSEEKANSQSPAKKFSKVYIRKDLIQKPDTDTVVLIKNMFSPNKSNSHLSNILERSSEKYSLNGHGKAMNGFPDTSSVVKTLDFDGKKKNKQVSPAPPIKKEIKEIISKEVKEKVMFKDVKEKVVSKEVKEKVVSKNELFELEATCEYQVGDLAWARVGTYPFWPCIVTREPFSDMFVKKKLFGRVERSVIHVTFFGDNGRRGWIVDNMLRKYHGRAEFEACRNKFTPESKKKDPRLYAAHFVSEKKLPLWNVSVKEAETLMKEPKRLRIDALYDMLEKARAAKTTPSKCDKGGKITRTGSDVSLSESLYDTLFSEDDGKQDDNRSNRARNKSLDVSEVVTACLDNMAARSGIIQIQRQSHMDRWLQKAKSKTPEKIQPKLHIKVEREKRKDKAKKKKEGKSTHKTRKNESLGSDTNLLPYQNEHDYSSVNYENHDINDSSNKNTDSASGLDSTLDTSTTISDIGVTVKIENISSSMEDCSQEDIITSIVNDDIVMTDSVNISKDETRNNETNPKDNSNNKIENNNEHILDTGNKDNNELVEIKEELTLNNCDLTTTIQPRRSKRKRQTFEGLNNSITEKKAKEPKLDLHNQKPNEVITTHSNVPKSNNNQESKEESEKESEKTEMPSNEPTIDNLDKKISYNIKVESTDSFPDQSKHPNEPLNSSVYIAQCESSYQKPDLQRNCDFLTVESHKKALAESEKCVKETGSITTTNDRDISTIRRSRSSKEKHDAKKKKRDLKESSKVESTDRMTVDNKSVVDNVLLNSENTDTENNLPAETKIEKETSLNSKESEKCVKEAGTMTTTNDTHISTIRRSRRSKEKHDAKKTKKDLKESSKVESTDRITFDKIPKSVIDNVPLNAENTDTENNLPTETKIEKETSLNSKESENCVKETSSITTTNDGDISTIRRSKEKHDAEKTIKDFKENNKVESNDRMAFDKITKSVVDNVPLNAENTDTENNLTTETKIENETSLNNKESENCVKETSSITTTNDRDISTIRRSRRSKEKHDTKKTKKDLKENIKVESTDRMAFDNIPKCVVDNVPLNSEKSATKNNLPTETETEKEICLNSNAESTELISCVSSISNPVVDKKQLNSENAVTVSNESTTINLDKETSQNRRVESMEICGNKPKDEIQTELLSSEITVTESDVPTLKNIEEGTSQNKKLESTEPIPCCSKSKPVVVIKPLNFESTILQSNTVIVTNLEETTKNSKPEATELMLLNNKSRPVVVIEPLNCENVVTECNPPIIANLEKETSLNNKLESMELMAFYKSSKPVVVIEPLDMQGLETQFVIKGSKPLVRNRSLDSLNKKEIFEDKSETSVLSDLVRNDVSNALKDVNNATEMSNAVDVELENVNTKPNTDTDTSSQYTDLKPGTSQDVSKNGHQETEIIFDDSERVEVDDCTSHVVEKDLAVATSVIPHTEITETGLDPSTLIESKIIEVPKQPFMKKDDDILKSNVQTNVVIGEETYVFDRTLSQDYDEIDGDCYDEYSHLPQVIINEEVEKAILIQNNLMSNKEISSQESCTDKTNNSTEKISSLSNESGPEIVKNDSQIPDNCIFLDKRNIQNDSETVEDHKVPTGDVSTIVKEENNSAEVTQDNNDKCVFLDQRSKTADAQSADNIEKKRKSPRLSLNRTRNHSLILNKVSDHLKPASVISNDDKMLISSKSTKSDPEFVKYMEIRQDALLDEQPDLTRDEIVTYLYKNWLYEEEKKSDMKKMDDNEQACLVKGFQESQQPKKIKKKRKVEKAAELKNIDIRKMLHKGKTKSFSGHSELSSEPLNNTEHNIASCEDSYQEPEPHQNNVLQTVESNKNSHTYPQKYVKETVSITNINDLSTVRRSRRSKDKHDTKKTMNELKEKVEDRCVVKIALINTIVRKVSTTRNRRLRLSNDNQDMKQIVNACPEKCTRERSEISSNDIEIPFTSPDKPKHKEDAKKAMDDPEFIKYLESHQDALLDEQPDLTQDELVTYLYKNWLYKDKSDLNFFYDNQQFNLFNNREPTPQQKNNSASPCNNKTYNTENNEHSGHVKGELDIVQSLITESEKCVLEMASSNDSEISVIKEELDAKETISTELEISSMNSNDSIMTKPTGGTKEKQDTKKAMNEPDFIKYLEMHQDALLDEQPDLTQDEIVNYLYHNWLYEESNKSEMKKIDDNEQSNLVKGLNNLPAQQLKKVKKKSKFEKVPVIKNVDIRHMWHKDISKPSNFDSEFSKEKGAKEQNKHNLSENDETSCGKNENGTQESKDVQNIDKLNNIVDSEALGRVEAISLKENTSDQISNNILKTFKEESSKNLNNFIEEAEMLQGHISGHRESNKSDQHIAENENNISKKSDDIEDMELALDELEDKDNEDSKESTHCKIINGFIEFEERSKSKINEGFDPQIVSIKSEDSGVSTTTRRQRKEKDAKSMDDPEFLKYLEARQDALIDEQPDLTQEEIVTYLYQTWFYEESTKSEMKKSDETEQSNLVKGLNQEPLLQPKKIKKRPKVEKEPVEKVKSTEVKDTKVEKSERVLKNADIRDMIQKPKRKATQSKPYYNEDDSDLEEEDLETFKIFDRDEPNADGEEIDEVELYFEQLTKPKPNVFKGYVRERVCENCYRAGNLVKCKSCHATYHVECVTKKTEVTEVAGPTRGRKRKRGRKPKGYDPSLDTGSQSDERSQDANNSEETNISFEDEAESHIVFDEDNFETLWENKMKELQTDTQDEYVSDQEIDWEVEPGHCEIVDLKHKEKPVDFSDYKCNNCLKYETPVCFVCNSNKSPKALTEVRQKCQVAHCHRYYHLECLDHWPQTQFNSWEPSKTNKKQIEYIEALSCPRHVCHTCVSDDPRGCKTRFCGDKLARCVKCPATYHSYTKCLPAGSQILTGSQIICPRHYEHRPGKVPCHVNTGWCFICALGGTLICCEYCPTSFHAECLNIKPPEGSYMCEDCETGRLPLYGEMVWVKLGHYRWWPGIVLHPTEIPDNILAVKHSPGEFVVRFFGQYDHYWVNRGRVFPFQEGDSGRISSQKSKIDAAFTTAMEHAQRACEILKKMEPNQEEDLDIASSLLPPHYVKLKVNKPAGAVFRRDVDANSLTQCDCDPNQPDPCGLYSHCLNRMLLTECGPLCRAGDRCHNRAFEKRAYPRLQAYRTPHRGWGLRTLQDIKQGQFVIEYVGELIDMEEFRRRMCRKHEIRDENFYFLTLDKERMIDAGPKGNLARFMNHCCEPNCETQKWTVLGDVRVGLFALYDIPANSEVTFNYNLECAGIEKKRCLCGAKRCSGYIGAKPKQLQEDKPKQPKRTYKKRKPVEEKPKVPKIKIKPIKPRELTEIEKDLLIIKNATNGISSDSEGQSGRESRLSVEDKNPKALKRKRVSFSTDESGAKKAKLEIEVDAV